jgi:hypothetical protein
MSKPSAFNEFVQAFRATIEQFPDKRTGNNKHYSLVDAALGAFAVFFTQSPSFLAYQRDMQARKGKNNAHTLFGLEEIPSDNQIRALLDAVSPERVFPLFEQGLAILEPTEQLAPFRSWQNRLLVVLDGTQYFSSQKISCPHCSTKKHPDGTTTYSHSMLTPVIVAPWQNQVLALPPEFIVPQDGHDKQDCENAAAKRWLRHYAKLYRAKGITILGDDLYSNQPMCEILMEEKLPFILVCKPDSHKTLHEGLESLEVGQELHQLTLRTHTPHGVHLYTYRYANHLPLRATADTVYVNWCELTLTTEQGNPLYHNAFVTGEKITQKNVAGLVAAGRTRWKVENENNNTLKTKGYHLEHNFGHGKQHLACVLATFNILAFLLHTLLGLLDRKYRLLRQTLVSRKTFFDDVRALTRYICFESWGQLLDFMLHGLEVAFPPNSS